MLKTSELKNKKEEEDRAKLRRQKQDDSVENSSEISFNGRIETLSKKIADIMGNSKVQNFSLKYKDSNFIQHALNLKDVFATICFSGLIASNPNMKKENKKPLMYNAAISTGLSIAGGYFVNELIKNPVNKFKENLIKANKEDPNLHRYLSGIKVLMPIVILSSVYYVGIPILSTFGAGKLSKPRNKQVESN